jgi:hypothetical protein
MTYIYLNKPKKIRGALPICSVMLGMILSFGGAIRFFPDKQVLGFGCLFIGVVCIICGWSVVSHMDAYLGSMPNEYLDSNFLFKGRIRTRKHAEYYPAPSAYKTGGRIMPGHSYVFFTARNEVEAEQMCKGAPCSYILLPKIKTIVPENELWVDGRNKEVYVNPKVWESMRVFDIYRHVFNE